MSLATSRLAWLRCSVAWRAGRSCRSRAGSCSRAALEDEDDDEDAAGAELLEEEEEEVGTEEEEEVKVEVEEVEASEGFMP